MVIIAPSRREFGRLTARLRPSFWTRDEIATARQRDIAIVPIVEAGAHFEQGIFGDIEYIEFAPSHIGRVVQRPEFYSSRRDKAGEISS